LGTIAGVVIVGFSVIQYKKYQSAKYKEGQEVLRNIGIANGTIQTSKDPIRAI
jgi:hypothetical protein